MRWPIALFFVVLLAVAAQAQKKKQPVGKKVVELKGKLPKPIIKLPKPIIKLPKPLVLPKVKPSPPKKTQPVIVDSPLPSTARPHIDVPPGSAPPEIHEIAIIEETNTAELGVETTLDRGSILLPFKLKRNKAKTTSAMRWIYLFSALVWAALLADGICPKKAAQLKKQNASPAKNSPFIAFKGQPQKPQKVAFNWNKGSPNNGKKGCDKNKRKQPIGRDFAVRPPAKTPDILKVVPVLKTEQVKGIPKFSWQLGGIIRSEQPKKGCNKKPQNDNGKKNVQPNTNDVPVKDVIFRSGNQFELLHFSVWSNETGVRDMCVRVLSINIFFSVVRLME